MGQADRRVAKIRQFLTNAKRGNVFDPLEHSEPPIQMSCWNEPLLGIHDSEPVLFAPIPGLKRCNHWRRAPVFRRVCLSFPCAILFVRFRLWFSLTKSECMLSRCTKSENVWKYSRKLVQAVFAFLLFLHARSLVLGASVVLAESGLISLRTLVATGLDLDTFTSTVLCVLCGLAKYRKPIQTGKVLPY